MTDIPGASVDSPMNVSADGEAENLSTTDQSESSLGVDDTGEVNADVQVAAAIPLSAVAVPQATTKVKDQN